MGPRRVPSPTCCRRRHPHSRRPWLPCRHRPRPWLCCRPATWHTPEARASQVQAAQMLPSSPVCGHKSQRQTKGKSGNHPPLDSNQVQLPPSDGLHDFDKCGLLACHGGREPACDTVISYAARPPPTPLPVSYLQHVSFLTLSVTQRTFSRGTSLCSWCACACVCMCVCVYLVWLFSSPVVLFSHVKICHTCTRPMAAAPVL